MKKIYEIESADEIAAIYQIELVDDVSSLWKELEFKSSAHFFLSWYWMGVWLEIILPVTKVYLYCYKQNTEIKGACFLTICSASRKKGLVRVRQLQMNEYLHGHYNMINGYNGILTVPGCEQSAWNFLIQVAQKFNNKWDEFFIGSLERQQRECCEKASCQQLTNVVDKQCFVWSKTFQRGAITQDLFIESFKRKTRQQLRQTIKAFAELGEIKIEIAQTLDRAKELFRLMEQTHTHRWVSVGRKGSYANKIWTRFHESLIDRFFDVGLIQLIRVSIGELSVGYLYGHTYRNKVYMHQTGFPQLEDNRLRSGYLSHLYAMLWNKQQGRIEYDFLPDFANSYKKFFVDAGEEVTWLSLRRNRLVFRWEGLIDKLKSRRQRNQTVEVIDGD